MSQHDFNIANQGFPAFRADLNNALGALATNSAGSTEPETTFAYQYWYDETTNLLKMRNAADDAWITLAFFDQTNDEWEVRTAVIQAIDGAGVSIKTDDGTTRISVSDAGVVSFENYAFPSADGTNGQVLTTDGSGTLTFTDSGAGDKIEEGNSSVEVVDTGTGYVAVTVDGTETARFVDGGDFNFNSGFGSVATAYGCRAWVNFDGTGTPAIRASGNVSSITDLGTGLYTANFSTTFPDDDYAVGAMAGDTGGGGSSDNCIVTTDTQSTTSVKLRIRNVQASGAPLDASFISVGIFR